MAARLAGKAGWMWRKFRQFLLFVFLTFFSREWRRGRAQDGWTKQEKLGERLLLDRWFHFSFIKNARVFVLFCFCFVVIGFVEFVLGTASSNQL